MGDGCSMGTITGRCRWSPKSEDQTSQQRRPNEPAATTDEGVASGRCAHAYVRGSLAMALHVVNIFRQGRYLPLWIGGSLRPGAVSCSIPAAGISQIHL